MELFWRRIQQCALCMLICTVLVWGQDNNSSDVTDAPIVTSTPIPTPTPAVGPNFVVQRGGKPCLRASFKADFTIRYNSKIPRGHEQRVISFAMPEAVSVSGVCENKTSSLTLSWLSGDYEFTMDFSKSYHEWMCSGASVKINTSSIEEYIKPINPGSHVLKTGNGESFYHTHINQSYECDTSEMKTHEYKAHHVDKSSFQYVTVDLTDIRVQAFDLAESSEFSEADTCPSKKRRSNAVPMIVAGCLACLILVIIVAYFISKNKNKITYKSVE